ncbi:hypothetical protein L227DRAFT_600692 [Lentinus tigrinus ALCF2SS1-6]|uniref:F-box domain-containing protein n=1 Tax=Lentinus tigrinus ALCF2SS1-6 TaxID=1328759 RepID=A0A5C2SAS6_9APHY|nr:hypothetical protein L227DRAFT_600692 [Lentinus tigrinus ALCF2SS1-6]
MQMKIPYDILVGVIEVQEAHGDLPGISSMSQTCRTLRGVAARHLLNQQVTLRNANDVVSFSLFMRSDNGRRLPLLRRCLVIKSGPLSEDAASSLVKLITEISHLERLVLRDADEVLASDPRLPRAFAALTCLKHLDFSMTKDPENPEPCVYMLTRMRSRLVTATLHPPVVVRRWHEGQVSDGLSDPISLLRSSASTLTELSGTWLQARKHRTVFPNVKRLRVLLHLIPDITPYIVAYPNLTSLDVRCGATMDEDILPGMSWLNQEGQQRTGCWPTLDSLEGRTMDLYVIALRCHVKSLTVHASQRHQAGDVTLLADVLSRARPVHLDLEVDSSSVVSETSSGLEAIFLGSGISSCIQSLELRIVMDPKTDLDQLISRTVTIVHSVTLTSFKLELDFSNRVIRLDRFARDTQLPPKFVPSEVAQGACNASTREKALNLKQNLPTLKSFVVKPPCRCNKCSESGVDPC